MKNLNTNAISDTLKMTMLLDFYGKLLTDKQREYYDLYHNEDLSLSEIAESAGISKQGVHDIISRAEKTLLELEAKTGIIERWSEVRAVLERAVLAGEYIHPEVLEYFQVDEF